MKTPPKSFVIEYKSSRRRPNNQRCAVWGNVDIKALARDVEADAPHLFAPTSKQDAAELNQRFNVRGEVNRADVNKEDNRVKSEPLHLEETPHPVAVADPIPACLEPAAAVVTTPGILSSGGSRRRRDNADIADQQTFRVNETVVSLQELSELEAENRELRFLMFEHLRRENQKLEEMLGRFT